MRHTDMNDTEFMAYAESVCFEHCWSANDITAVKDSGYGVYLVERDDSGEPIGYVLGRVSFDEAELYRIAVLPEKRRNHAGERLVKAFTEKCAEMGAEKIFLEVRSKNVPALKLYELCGFSKLSVRKGYYGDDDAVIYVLYLKSGQEQ